MQMQETSKGQYTRVQQELLIKGLVFEDVDMTDDEKRPISVIVAGRVLEDRLPATVDTTAKTELQALGIVFVEETEVVF